MDNKVFLLGLFLLSVANVKAQTQTQNDSLTMENMMHNLPKKWSKVRALSSRLSEVCYPITCRYS